MPVTLPPGRAKLTTRPRATGSSVTPNTIGMVAVAAFAAKAGRGASGRDNHSDLAAHQLGRHRRQPIVLAFGEAIFDRYVVALDVAGFGQTLAKNSAGSAHSPQPSRAEKAYHRHLRLLRPRRHRPRRRRAAEQR